MQWETLPLFSSKKFLTILHDAVYSSSMDLVAANTLQQKKIFHPSHVYRASHFFFMRMTSSPIANEQIYVFRSSRMSSYISVCDHQTAHEYEKTENSVSLQLFCLGFLTHPWLKLNFKISELCAFCVLSWISFTIMWPKLTPSRLIRIFPKLPENEPFPPQHQRNMLGKREEDASARINYTSAKIKGKLLIKLKEVLFGR